MLMTPPLAVALLNAQPKLVSMSKSIPQYVSTATLLKTWSTTPTTEPAHADLDSTLIPPRPSSASPAQLFTAQSATQPTLQFALLVLLELSLMPPPILALVELDTLSTEPLALNALTSVKTAALLLEPVPHVLTVPTEIWPKIVSASMDSSISTELLLAHLVLLHVSTALMHQLVQLVMLQPTEFFKVDFVFVPLDTMNSSTPISPEPVRNATQNASIVQLPLLFALLVIPPKIELLELTLKTDKPVSVLQDFTHFLTVHADNLTVMLIPSALSANKVSTSASSALPLKTEFSSFLKASVFVLKVTILTPTTLVFNASQDAPSAAQPLTVPLVLPWQPPTLTALVHALQRHISPPQPME